MYDVTEYRYGQPIPLEVVISFSLSYHDWLKLQNSDAWQSVESLMEYLQTGQYKTWMKDQKAESEAERNTSGASRQSFR